MEKTRKEWFNHLPYEIRKKIIDDFNPVMNVTSSTLIDSVYKAMKEYDLSEIYQDETYKKLFSDILNNIKMDKTSICKVVSAVIEFAKVNCHKLYVRYEENGEILKEVSYNQTKAFSFYLSDVKLQTKRYELYVDGYLIEINDNERGLLLETFKEILKEEYKTTHKRNYIPKCLKV